MAGLFVLMVVGALLMQPATSLDPATISAAATAIATGASLAGTTMSGLTSDGYKISSAAAVENWTKFSLLYPVVRLGEGAISMPPELILPSKKEAMVVRKAASTVKGTHGTVSWLIEGLNRRVFVMWSIPFDYNWYSNWLGVGISREGYTSHPSGNTVFNLMYYKSSSSDIRFTIGKYQWNSETIVYSDGVIEVTGTMGTGHKANIEITVRPVNTNNLAAPIRVQLENELPGAPVGHAVSMAHRSSWH